MNRRDFLKALGLGAAALAVEEPVRKMWFVPSTAPVGSRVERFNEAFLRHTEEHCAYWEQFLAEGESIAEGLYRDLMNLPGVIPPDTSTEFIPSVGPTLTLEPYPDPPPDWMRLSLPTVEYDPLDGSLTFQANGFEPIRPAGMKAWAEADGWPSDASGRLYAVREFDRLGLISPSEAMALIDCSGRPPRKT